MHLIILDSIHYVVIAFDSLFLFLQLKSSSPPTLFASQCEEDTPLFLKLATNISVEHFENQNKQNV